MGPKKRASSGDKAESEPVAKLNKTSTDFSSIDFSANGNSDNSCFKVTTWNVDGLRAWIKKGGLEFFDHEKPDVICLQETKCSTAKLPDEVTKGMKDYPHKYWFPSTGKEGYSGVGLMSKKEPLKVMYGFEGINDEAVKEHDAEGRLVTAEFEGFFVCGVYVPNAGKKLITLPKRLEWDGLFRNFLNSLGGKPVVVCGDLNVAHLEIDLANPKTNKKNAGFTKEERDGFGEMIKECKVVDTFRHFYPDQEKKYTFWTYMMNARSKNVGWRLDYFLVSESMMDKVVDNVIRDQVYGSDHCPSTLFLNVD